VWERQQRVHPITQSDTHTFSLSLPLRLSLSLSLNSNAHDAQPDTEFLISCTYVEVYNEMVRNLLQKGQDNMQLKEDKNRCTHSTAHMVTRSHSTHTS